MTGRTLTGAVLFCGLCLSGCANRQAQAGNLASGSSLARDEADPWDSGRTAGEVTVQIPCGGRPAKQSQGITFLRAERARDTKEGVGRAIFKMGSGEYEFCSPWSL